MDWTLQGDDYVVFTINGHVYHVSGSEVDAETSLNTYIRENANWKGTKYMCREGGCGACIVTVTAPDPSTGLDRSFAVNSCLVSVFSCHGLAITTIEGIGNKKDGYHKVQKALYAFNGTQCGYCSPGQVMNMYSLLRSNPMIKMDEVESSFGGSICRCTGYRPILDAFKSLAADASNELKDKLLDIEDLGSKCKINCNKDCSKENGFDEDYSGLFLETSMASKNLSLNLKSGVVWYRVSETLHIFQLFDLVGDSRYMLVAGNTAQGVYREANLPTVYIDINEVKELKKAVVFPEHILLGGNITLSDMKELFNRVSSQNPLFYGYTKGLADHLDLVANVPVRNIATLAGNLMIKHQHREFPSDLFLILETCGARLTIRDRTGLDFTITLLEFLETNMDMKLIINVILPALSSNHYVYRSFKIMPRRQNVHASVNAGFLFRLQLNNNCIVEEHPTIVFGHISPEFTHAFETETFLVGKSLCNSAVLNKTKYSLAKEIRPSPETADEPSTTYREKLAIALFYKFVLEVNGKKASEEYRSGAGNLIRPLSSGKQEFSSITKEPPVHLPELKLEGLIQCSGEAEYIDDMPYLPGQLFSALVITDRARAKIISIDTSVALNVPGVVAFYSAKDIPGINSFANPDGSLTLEEEELFCKEDVKYAGQPVGIIVANTQDIAKKATALVKIQYSSVVKPLITIKDVLNSGDSSRIRLASHMEPVSKKGNVAHKITGEFEMGSQYHFTMELQTCFCIPKDDGLDVYSATQWIHNTQASIAKVLGVQLNSLNLHLKRVGGAYGGKLTRSALVASACSLAAHKLQRPVRLVVDLETTMKAIGKRCFFLVTYEVGVDENGAIQYLTAKLYENMGCTFNDNVSLLTRDGVKNCYDSSTWNIDIYLVKTDMPSATWTRAPGTLEGMATIDHIMEHIASVCKKDPVSVRRLNFSKTSQFTGDILNEVLKSSEFDKRLSNINHFNQVNRWRKRGISAMPMEYMLQFSFGYYSTVSVFFNDGTVAVSTGGVEFGQGINTKVAQICAYKLGIDIGMIKIKPCYNVMSPNNGPSAGSIGTDTVTYATMRCCEELNRRLQPIRQKMKNPSWTDLIMQAYTDGVNLKATYMYSIADSIPQNYSIYGATVLELEVDVLTGQYQILRADIVEDAGESLNPLLDVGQVEGAFVMGLGYFSSERIAYDENDGSVQTTRTWTYWPPGPKDIPVDFRVTLKKNATNPVGVLRSKATGEPPLCMSFSLVNALRHALKSARKDAGLTDEWFTFDPPCTFENTFLTAGTSEQQFKL